MRPRSSPREKVLLVALVLVFFGLSLSLIPNVSGTMRLVAAGSLLLGGLLSVPPVRIW